MWTKKKTAQKINFISFPLFFFPTGNYAVFVYVKTIILRQTCKKDWMNPNVGKCEKTVYNLSIDVLWRSFKRKHGHNQNYLIPDERKKIQNNIYKYMRTVLALFGIILSCLYFLWTFLRLLNTVVINEKICIIQLKSLLYFTLNWTWYSKWEQAYFLFL